MDFLRQLDFWLLIVGSALLLRQFFVSMAAEHGRKQDLVKKLYKANQDFHLSVLVPYLDNRHLPHLMNLLAAIDDQEYPVTKVTVHIVTGHETQDDLEQHGVLQLRRNVKVWHYPAYKAPYEDAIAWLIDRCLAVGGSGIFVFLKPTDLIKPDFFQNIVARGFDSFVIQGYVANKHHPEALSDKVLALSRRLTNRIENAGRYHMGLSCRLQDSGWAIKQEVLEMIPFHRGRDLDNLEYSLRLNLQNYRVSWAPSVVVYSEDEAGFIDFVTLAVGACFNRLRLLLAYGPQLLTRAIMRLDLTSVEDMLTIVRPPAFLMGLTLVLLGLVSWVNPLQGSFPGHPGYWFSLAAGVFLLQALSMLVARCKGVDYAVMLFLTPVVYLLGTMAVPLALVQYLSSEWLRNNANRQETSYKKQRTTRFDEDQEPNTSLLDSLEAYSSRSGDHGPSRRVIDEILNRNHDQLLLDPDLDSALAEKLVPNALLDSANAAKATNLPFKKGKVFPNTKLATPKLEAQKADSPEPPAPPKAMLPREHIKSVPLSNGRNQVECLLKTQTTYNDEGEEFYRLTLEYKTLSFSTATYRILDQAFYELYTKLSGKGLTIITCGSCGYFHNPTADMPGAIRNAGVCLFGKTGKEVNLNTDAVTVLSQACDYHTSIDQREAIVQQWRDSVARAKVRAR